jgi:hypothetical protein
VSEYCSSQSVSLRLLICTVYVSFLVLCHERRMMLWSFICLFSQFFSLGLFLFSRERDTRDFQLVTGSDGDERRTSVWLAVEGFDKRAG